MEEVLNGLGYLNLNELKVVLERLKQEIANRQERKRLAMFLDHESNILKKAICKQLKS